MKFVVQGHYQMNLLIGSITMLGTIMVAKVIIALIPSMVKQFILAVKAMLMVPLQGMVI